MPCFIASLLCWLILSVERVRLAILSTKAAVAGTLLLAIIGCGKTVDLLPVNQPKPPPVLVPSEIGKLRDRIEKLENLVATQEAALAELQSRSMELPAVIEAQNFVLKGGDGKTRARLGFDRVGKLEAVPGFYLYDTNGTKRVAAIDTVRTAGLVVWNSSGRFCAGICDGAITLWEPGRKPKNFTNSTCGSSLYAPQKPAPDNYIGNGPPRN